MILLDEHPWKPFALELIEEAKKARERSYAPYSKFRVGVALMTVGKDIYVGANMEEAAFEVLHAERAAFSAMNMAGDRSPVLLACVGAPEHLDEPVVGLAPCGHCRQDIKEFASLTGAQIEVVIRKPVDGMLYVMTIEELLPFSFGPADVGVDLTKYRR